MRLVVSGALGFIGRHLVAELRDRHEITALVRAQDMVDIPKGIRVIAHDLTAPIAEAKLPVEVDAVIHLAQSVNYRSFPTEADDIAAVNIQSTVRLLDYARRAGARCFIAASTGGVYGHAADPSCETDLPHPEGFYAATRYSAELLAQCFADYMSVVVFRFFFVYGPRQRGMLVSNLVGRVLANEEVTIEGRPGLRINPIFVADAVRAFEPALALGSSGIFNIAGDEDVTITDIVRLAAEAAGRDARIRYAGEPAATVLLGDNARMKSVLGVCPRVTVREGLTHVVRSLTEDARR